MAWTKAYTKEYMRQYHQIHKIEATTSRKIYQKTHAVELHNYHQKYGELHKEELRESKRQYYLKNKEKILNYSKQYRENNREKVALAKRVCRQNNPLKYKALRISRLALGKIKKHDIQRLYEDNIKLYGTLTCVLCEKPILFGFDTIEHLTPISRGGTNEYSNLAVAHGSCNTRKYTRTIDEWRVWYKLTEELKIIEQILQEKRAKIQEIDKIQNTINEEINNVKFALKASAESLAEKG